MIGCELSRAKRILCLGAHSDDIEIGCGGTILKILQRSSEIEIVWYVGSAGGIRKHEAQQSAVEFLRDAGWAEIQFGMFKESHFPEQWSNIKNAIEGVKAQFNPDIVFTHYREDRHQDHKVISDMAWNTFRNHLILEYEIPKYDGDLGQPNFYVPLEESLYASKTDALMKHFASQASKHWFTKSAFEGLARVRGIECAAHFAEAFYCRKIVF
jgi:LmbE family N-acetylglucosaminyl deacetylase